MNNLNNALDDYDINNINKLPEGFDYRIYWQLNGDLHDTYDKDDEAGLNMHWLRFGKHESREYKYSTEITQNFKHKVYFSLYDDLQECYDKDDHLGLLTHYMTCGINEGRICSVDKIKLPNNFFLNPAYSFYKNPDNFISKYATMPPSEKVRIHYYKSLSLNNPYIKYLFDIANKPKNQDLFNISTTSDFNQIVESNPNILFIINDVNTNRHQNVVSKIDLFKFLNPANVAKYNSSITFYVLIKLLLRTIEIYKNFKYYYYLNNDVVINMNYIENMLNTQHLIYGSYSYNINIDNISLNNSFIFNQQFLKNIEQKTQLIEQQFNFQTNDLPILIDTIVKLSDYKLSMPVILIIEAEQMDFNFMYQNWIKYITNKHNLKIVIVSKQTIDTTHITNEEFLHFIQTQSKIENKITDIINLISYIKKIKMQYDWIIYTNNKIHLNLKLLENTISKWYQYNMVYDADNNIYCFRNEFLCENYERIIDMFTNKTNYEEINGLINASNDVLILNIIFFCQCVDMTLTNYFGFIV